MLELRPGCERCDKDLPAESETAFICSFECTFCAECSEDTFALICPNCGGNLVKRPSRPGALLEKYPATKKRTYKPTPER